MGFSDGSTWDYPHLVIETTNNAADTCVYWFDPKTDTKTSLTSIFKVEFVVEVKQLNSARVSFEDVRIVQRDPEAR